MSKFQMAYLLVALIIAPFFIFRETPSIRLWRGLGHPSPKKFYAWAALEYLIYALTFYAFMRLMGVN